MKEIITNHFFSYIFIYIFFFICFILFIFLLIANNIKLKKFILLLIALFFSLLISEFYFLCFGKNFIRGIIADTVEESKFPITINDDIYATTVNCSIPDYLSDSEKIHPKTYNNGFRYTNGNEKSEKAFVFLGCSFVFGHGVKDNETIPYFFSELTDFRYYVLNCGVCSRGTNTVLNILNSDIIDKFTSTKKKEYFVYLLMFDHIYRNFRIYTYFAHDNWLLSNGIWERTSHPFYKLKLLFARSYVFDRVFKDIIDNNNKEFYENYMLESLKKINGLINERYDSKLIIIVWPGGFENNILEKIKDTNMDLIFLPEYFCLEEEYRVSRDDAHPSAKANKEIAKILYNHMRQQDKTN